MLGTNSNKVRAIANSTSKRYGVRIVKFANVGNHLHLVVKLPGSAMTARRHYTKWIRTLTSSVAFAVGGSKKGEPLRDKNGNRAKFWDSFPFSRVIHGRQGWRTIDRYVMKNQFEAQGLSTELATAMARELYDSNRLDEMAAWRDSGCSRARSNSFERTTTHSSSGPGPKNVNKSKTRGDHRAR